MPTYIVNATGGQLWRISTGNKGDIMPAGMVFESAATATIKDRLCRRVDTGPYADGKNYVQASDVTAYSVPEPPPPPPPDDTADSYRVDLGVYIQPDAGSTRIGELAQGETVISIELRDGWLMIERGTGGQTGWVRTTHLAPVGDAPTLPFAPHLVKHIWLDAAGNPIVEETYEKKVN